MSDLIRRSDAIKAVNKAKAEGMTECPTYYLGIVPTIEPKRGEWKKVKNVHAWDVSGIETWGVKRKCTNCDFRHTFIEDHGHYNFCPNCGANMNMKKADVERKESE